MVDFDFISYLEGNNLTGYVPDLELSRAGVIIGSGYDLGQSSEEELKKSFPYALAQKLMPYAGKIKQDACAALKAKPLEVTEEEGQKIKDHCHRTAIDRLENEWGASRALEDFCDLSDTCQTVVASVAFQYGDLEKRTPNFWRQVTSYDWTGALENLRMFGDDYSERRNKEADALEAWLKTEEQSKSSAISLYRSTSEIID